MPRHLIGVEVSSKKKTGYFNLPKNHQKPNKGLRKIYFEHYENAKKKPPLIALHGGPGVAANVEGLLANTEFGKVIQKNFDILYFHQRGCGQSLLTEENDLKYVSANGEDYSISQYREDIEALRRSFFPKDKVTIFGGSWGGYLGIDYVAHYESNVTKAIIGSAEAATNGLTSFAANFEVEFLRTIVDHPKFSQVFSEFLFAVRDGKIVYKNAKGKSEKFRCDHIFPLVYAFTMKASYEPLRKILLFILRNSQDGKDFLQKMFEEEGEDLSVSMGGSLPAESTFSQNMLDAEKLRHSVGNNVSEIIDVTAYDKAVLEKCRVYGEKNRPFDCKLQLVSTSVPFFFIAGIWDVVTPLQFTAKTASLVRNMQFHKVTGGHTPFAEGGEALAKDLRKFLRG